MSPKVEVLVVDTTAFINNTALHELGNQITTVQEVVNEITSKRQIRRLVVLPYDLEVKTVFQENIQYVTEFSKKTGDYPSLSATDIKVMALAYQLEKERVGTDHLKKEPLINRLVTFIHHLPDESKATAGFYAPSKKNADENDESCDTEINDLLGKLTSLDCNKTDEDIINDILVPVKENIHEQTYENELECSDINSDCSESDYASDAEDGSGWITPQNIAQKKQEVNSEVDNAPVKVACITSDFAMQNVLKQIGLNVLSSDGRHIRQLRSFILRCYACFKTTSIMTKVFCPNCGNRTLKKVAVSLKEDGTQVIHLSSRKRLSTRGKRFSLPTPKGGKHANNPILCEDQRIPDQRPSRLARTKNNPLDPDYTAGYSPFVIRDTNSRSAMLGIRGTDIISMMRRNPNEGRCKGKKKK
ncbi:RNA-binding protein NOB1 [Zootermopsis nevadensis]|uniref:RNA-binding protein NOB1 n=1 Tax=Zootermopsis nevadensis TaxID=136037 RepID=A0A067RGR6_ZOONE|nr:RNA-binding protein NOB1 [Zootermopsis nevadensis]KDR22203.1 RNA-binding protein NOB1 [Zootermopsis nevadensis]